MNIDPKNIISDEKIANLVQQHLIVDLLCTDIGDTNESGSQGQEAIPIPYHLPGTAITHDILQNQADFVDFMFSNSSSNNSKNRKDFLFLRATKPLQNSFDLIQRLLFILIPPLSLMNPLESPLVIS
ncbi:hypothetical protein BDF14DRAFT_1830207 [Spinellus fusiger]|nr:hypothetical protein BDF14DRAFT_1830207 [Spinellus fusiger]